MILMDLGETHDRPCVYCGEEMTPNNASLDHMIPQARGGEEHPQNYQIVCLPCNKAKGKMTHFEFDKLCEGLAVAGTYAWDLVMRKLRCAWRVR